MFRAARSPHRTLRVTCDPRWVPGDRVMTGPVVSALFLLAGLSLSAGLTCAPCEKASCSPPDCPGRIVRDVCGCCEVCARGLGERCGGHFNSLGLCDDGLVCETSPEHGQLVVTAAKGVCKGEYLCCPLPSPLYRLANNRLGLMPRSDTTARLSPAPE